MTDDEDYKQVYKDYLLQFINEVFVPSKLSEAYTNYYNMIKDYAYAEESGYTYLRYDSEFDQAVETLKLHVQERNDAVNSYL